MPDLIVYDRPHLIAPRMVMGFTGWMDGGRVSTGTVELLADAFEARRFAEINSAEFYIHNFPVATLPMTIVTDGEKTVVKSVSAMDQAAIFRPHAQITDGVVRRLDFQRNDLLASEEARLVLLHGEEPHIRWRSYAECLLGVAEDYDIREFCFIGSVASPIPHTREPRLRMGVSAEFLRNTGPRPEIGTTDYEGPASFITYLMTLVPPRGIEMRSLVVEIPHYPFLEMPAYPASILKIASFLGEWLELDLPLSDLEEAAGNVGSQLDALMEENEDFGHLVRKLEEVYDAEETSHDEQLLRRLIDQIDLSPDGQGN